jgi:Cyclic nucleotide-binding domain
MADPEISRYADLLRQQYIFQGLNDAQLAHVVSHFVRVEKYPGEQVYAQGDPGDSFYVIYQGKVRVTQVVERRERQLRILGPGDYFGDGALLFDRPRSDSVATLEHTVLLCLDREAFYELLDLLPDIRMNLSATAESRYLALKENFDWLGDDEVIYLIRRKNEFFLFLSLLLPLFVFLFSIPVFVFSFSLETPFFTNAFLIAGVLGLIGSVLWAVWNWIDWGNDYYIVTSQRVVWLERVIIFYYSRREAPLTQVLAVNTSSTFIGRLLNYGNVDVRTFTGSILMRNMADPKQFASFIEGHQSRARRQLRAVEAQIMEKELHKRIHKLEPPPPVEPPPHKPPEEKPPKKPKRSYWKEILDTFLKVRFEQGDVITYRKHWLVLLGKTFAPLLALFMWAVIAVYLLYQYLFKEGLGISGLAVAFVMALLFVAAFLWWGYNYLDWNNDIYQLTPDQIIDIERKPLGEEQKKTAPLDSILSLEHVRQGIIRLAFNYGDVIVMVGQTPFKFRGVHNPDQVHQDVADYIEARSRKSQQAEADRERQRMLDWFGTYHREMDNLEESKKDTDWDLFPG